MGGIMSTTTTMPPPPPSRQCDLVMKGGITSGVVYPAAVMALKDTFRFRSIGGTSAGAIAAALTGAAAGAGVTWLLAQLFDAGFPPRALVLFSISGAVIGAYVAAILWAFFILFFYLPRRAYFGLCQGYIKDDPNVLTNWLHAR